MKSRQQLRILLTRSSEGNAEWSIGLAAAGHEVVDWPCIQTESLLDAEAELRDVFTPSDWITFTSTRALEALVELASDLDLPGKKLACVGEVTAGNLRAMGLAPDLISSSGTAHSLGSDLLERCQPGQQVLILGALNGRQELAQVLEAAGQPFQQVALYKTETGTAHQGEALPPVDAIFFASPSAVHGFLSGWHPNSETLVISIGPSTSEALVSAGLRADGEAATRDISGMLDALARAREAPASNQ